LAAAPNGIAAKLGSHGWNHALLQQTVRSLQAVCNYRSSISSAQISYELTQHDFFESTIAIRNRKNWAKWGFRAILGLLLSLIALSALVLPRSQLLSNLTPLLLLLLLWVFLLWASPWWFARTQYRKQPSVQGKHTASFDADAVQWLWDGGSSVVEWKNYVRWMETKNQILLCSSPIQCGIVPKRALSAEQLSELRTLLTERIGAGLRV